MVYFVRFRTVGTFGRKKCEIKKTESSHELKSPKSGSAMIESNFRFGRNNVC